MPAGFGLRLGTRPRLDALDRFRYGSVVTEGKMAVTLGDGDFEAAVATGVTLVDFWAEWCGPCRAAAPYVEKLSAAMDGRSKVAKVNVDEEPGIAQKYGVMSIPTFILFKDGEVVERSTGFSPRFVEDWMARIETALEGA